MCGALTLPLAGCWGPAPGLQSLGKMEQARSSAGPGVPEQEKELIGVRGGLRRQRRWPVSE